MRLRAIIPCAASRPRHELQSAARDLCSKQPNGPRFASSMARLGTSVLLPASWRRLRSARKSRSVLHLGEHALRKVHAFLEFHHLLLEDPDLTGELVICRCACPQAGLLKAKSLKLDNYRRDDASDGE